MNLDTPLTAAQVRILGCLVEKAATTPDQYPLTENALRNACNQKSSRDPVMALSEGEVGHELRTLDGMGLVHESWSARASRWAHDMNKALGLHDAAVAALAVLMLRGPQTTAEVRSHAHRLHEFEDVDETAYTLRRLAEREPSLVMLMPLQPGTKGQRWAHLLAGEPAIPEATSMPAPSRPQSGLEERLLEMESAIAALEARVNALEER